MSDCSNYGGGNCGSTPTTTVTSIGVPVHTHTDSGLPFTGGDVVGLAMLGIGMLSAGVALVRSGRRKAVA